MSDGQIYIRGTANSVMHVVKMTGTLWPFVSSRLVCVPGWSSAESTALVFPPQMGSQLIQRAVAQSGFFAYQVYSTNKRFI